MNTPSGPDTLNTSTDLAKETPSDITPPTCPEDFFFNENSSSCVPICGEFSYFKPGVEILSQLAVCLCFIASTVMLILSLTINRKKTASF